MAMFRIDKSLFDSPEELAEYERLVAKATVDPEAGQDEMEDEVPDTPPAEDPAKKACGKKPAKKAEDETMEVTKKSAPEAEAELSPVMKAAMDDLAALKKSFEMKEMTDVAKKYAPLGKKEDELAKILYDMKKSNEANYNAYIAVLDESLGIIEKSGLFAEIGKSAGGYSAAGGAESKAQAKAREIQKADPSVSWDEAIAKAWEDPALMAEYDAEYNGR